MVCCAEPSQTFGTVLRNVSEALTAAQQHSAVDFLQVIYSPKSKPTLRRCNHFAYASRAGQAFSPGCRCTRRSLKL